MCQRVQAVMRAKQQQVLTARNEGLCHDKPTHTDDANKQNINKHTQNDSENSKTLFVLECWWSVD